MKPRPPAPWPKMWFLRTAGYRLYMARELTAFFLAVYLVLLVVFIFRAGQGYDQYRSFMAVLSHPLMIVLHVLFLVAACLHSVTWFNLTPSIMAARIGEEKVPGALVAIGTGYLPWLVVSLVAGWWLLA